MTIGEWLKRAADALQAGNCPDPKIDARWIAEDVLHMNAAALRFESARSLTPPQLQLMNALLDRRVGGEPVQYVLGCADFMGLKFHVDSRVLIPRQDTETLVETALAALKPHPRARVLDLCTGSGAIGLSIKALCPAAEVTIADVSPGALEVARQNAMALKTPVEIREGDLFSAVAHEKFDFILSNPPYIPRGDLAGLQREVQREPMLALDGGEDGLDIYRRIAAEAGAHLNPGGSIYLEVGVGESEAVLSLIRENIACAQSGALPDLNGIPRVVWARSVAIAGQSL